MEIIEMLIQNGDSIAAVIGSIFSAIIGILTVVNMFMPGTISNPTLAKLEYVTSKISLGTKKAVIKK